MKNNMRKWLLSLAVCAALWGMTGCEKAEDPPKETDTKTENQGSESTDPKVTDPKVTDLKGTPSDYSREENWMRIPEITHKADTVYLYPTCYLDESEDAKPICDIDNEAVRERARAIYENQATVFEESTNVFAPYYRQSNIFTVGGMSQEELEEYQRNEQRTDIYAALDYYFENYNEGRPFIIAGHSQGSIMTKIVLGEYMAAHPEHYERMIAAYPIGFSITEDWLLEHPYLKFAEGADDIGVIVSWNTEGTGNQGQDNLVVEKGALSINPINWRRDDTYAGFEENLGSRILNEETGEYEILKGVADAQVDTERGVVICTAEDVEYSPEELFGPESLHGHDYDFYYVNLQENVETRVKAWMETMEQ